MRAPSSPGESIGLLVNEMSGTKASINKNTHSPTYCRDVLTCTRLIKDPSVSLFMLLILHLF